MTFLLSEHLRGALLRTPTAVAGGAIGWVRLRAIRLSAGLSLTWWAAIVFVLGTVVGRGLVKVIVRLADGESLRPPLSCSECGGRFAWRQQWPIVGYVLSRGRCHNCGGRVPGWVLLLEVGTGLLFTLFFVDYFAFACQKTPEVVPDAFWRSGRVVYHLILITLLVAATGTDLRDYVIPDQITVTGLFVGVAGAVLSGDLQIIHLWVDWNQEIEGLRGPFIPSWIVRHPHWHGLAWSTAGVLAGGGVTWVIRALSSLLLGREALGLGDVTLMAMIGSFLGWQPVVFVFLLAPLCALFVGLTVRVLTGRTIVPFGPFLSAAAVVVLLSWNWLWMPTRHVFGHGPSLVVLASVALVAFVLLLGGLRIYRSIPAGRRDSSEGTGPTASMNQEHGDSRTR